MATILALTQLHHRSLSTIPNPTTLTIAQGMNWQSQIYATVLWNTQPVVLDVTKILCRAASLTPSQTLEAYLTSVLSDQFVASYQTSAVPQPTDLGRYLHRLVTYDPLGHPGFSIMAGDDYGHVADPQRMEASKDLLITGPDNHDFTNSFVLVNGVAHPVTATGSMLCVKDGARNLRLKGATNILIADTTGLGGHSVVPLTRDMLEASTTDPWFGVTLNLPSVNLTSSTVLLVIDGILHVLDDTYRPLNAQRLWLNVPRLDLVKAFIHNPNITFNPLPRNHLASVMQACDAGDPVVPAQTEAPDYLPGTPNYAGEIGQFLLETYPSLAQQVYNAGYASPMVLADVGSRTALLAQVVTAFLTGTYPNLVGDAGGLVVVEEGPPPGDATVLQAFLTEIYPTLWCADRDAAHQTVLMYLSPAIDDPAYVINDVLVNTYPYLSVERGSRDVALISVGTVDDPGTALQASMTQFFNEYYPDMNTPAQANPNLNVAVTELESDTSFQISLRGQKGLEMELVQNRSFLYQRLFSTSSFLIVIPNQTVYLRRYPLHSTETAYRFSWIGPDTPRGLLRYDQRAYLPYTILASEDFRFLVHIGLPSDHQDLIETSIDFSLWPAPHYDPLDLQSPRDAELIDLYTT